MSFLLSDRGQELAKPSTGYFTEFGRIVNNRFHHELNPEGYFILAVAENRLSYDLIQQKIKDCRQLDDDAACYAENGGTLRFREAMCSLMNQTFVKTTLHPENMIITAGASPALDHLSFVLCNPGDGIIIPAPYYPAFDGDLAVRNQVVPLPAHTLPPQYELTPELLEKTWLEAVSKGITVKGVLLSTPSNPLGRVYTRKELIELVEWCSSKNIHLISDEVYANSCFRKSAEDFVSVFDLVHGNLEDGVQNIATDTKVNMKNRTHLLYSLSKDFGISGYRVGVVYSENQDFIAAMMGINYFCLASNDTQYALTSMLKDIEFIHNYKKINNERLFESYSIVECALKAMNVPFYEASSALFVYIDLSSYLPEIATPEDETELWRDILDNHHVLLTPGLACHSHKPGFFRICYAWVCKEHLQVAMSRLADCLSKRIANKK